MKLIIQYSPQKVSQAQYQSHAGIELNGSIKSFLFSYFLNETEKLYISKEGKCYRYIFFNFCVDAVQ